MVTKGFKSEWYHRWYASHRRHRRCCHSGMYYVHWSAWSSLFPEKKSKRISSKTLRKVEKKVGFGQKDRPSTPQIRCSIFCLWKPQVHEHNRKQKKEARKNPGKRKGMRGFGTVFGMITPTSFLALKKDPGIPNSLPFKEDILAEIVEKKRKVSSQAAVLFSFRRRGYHSRNCI